MYQLLLTDSGFEKFHKQTKKEQFLVERDSIIPWQELTVLLNPTIRSQKEREDDPWDSNE